MRDIVAELYTVGLRAADRPSRIEESSDTVIHAIALRCQVRIEPQRRSYTEAEWRRGYSGCSAAGHAGATPCDPSRMQCNATVQGFRGTTELDLALPCTYDFEVTGSKYLHALRDGAVPLALLFSGTIFTRGNNGFGVEQVAWDCEGPISCQSRSGRK